MKSTRNAFVEKAKQSTFVPKWGLSTRPTHPLVDRKTPGPSEKTETVTTKSAISLSPLPDSQVKIKWAEGTKTESVIAASCSISSQGDMLTITYKCPPSDTLSTKKANEFFNCLNLSRIANHASLAENSGEQIIPSAQSKDKQRPMQSSEVIPKGNQNVGNHGEVNSCLNSDQVNDSHFLKSSREACKAFQAQHSLVDHMSLEKGSKNIQTLVKQGVVNRGTTSKTLSCVELNQTERVSIEKSTSVEDTRQQATRSEPSSCVDVDEERRSAEKSLSDRSSLGTDQKISSDEEVDRKKWETAVKRRLSSSTEGPRQKLLKATQRYSESYMGYVANFPSTSGGSQRDKSCAHSFKRAIKHCTSATAHQPEKNKSKTAHRLPESLIVETSASSQLSSDSTANAGELFAPSSGESSTYYSTMEESDVRTTTFTNPCPESDRNEGHTTSCSTIPPTLDEMELRNNQIPFPKVTMRSYQNISGNDVWELSLRFH